MSDHIELKGFLSLLIIILFAAGILNAMYLPGKSGQDAYSTSTVSAFAIVWALMLVAAHREPDRYSGVISATITGLVLIAFFDSAMVLSGSAEKFSATIPFYDKATLADALWIEASSAAFLAFVLFYFKPKKSQSIVVGVP